MKVLKIMKPDKIDKPVAVHVVRVNLTNMFGATLAYLALGLQVQRKLGVAHIMRGYRQMPKPQHHELSRSWTWSTPITPGIPVAAHFLKYT